MSQHDTDRYWFKAKTYGYGWGLPCAWPGWVVLAAYLFLVLGGGYVMFDPFSTGALLMWLGWTLACSAALILICRLKGPAPRWRWGNKSKE